MAGTGYDFEPSEEERQAAERALIENDGGAYLYGSSKLPDPSSFARQLANEAFDQMGEGDEPYGA